MHIQPRLILLNIHLACTFEHSRASLMKISPRKQKNCKKGGVKTRFRLRLFGTFGLTKQTKKASLRPPSSTLVSCGARPTILLKHD
jgi:hypothetical protein